MSCNDLFYELRFNEKDMETVKEQNAVQVNFHAYGIHTCIFRLFGCSCCLFVVFVFVLFLVVVKRFISAFLKQVYKYHIMHFCSL